MEQDLYDLPEGWVWKPLGIATEVLGGGTPKTKASEYWGGEIVWLSPTDLPPIGEITHISDSTKKITEIGLAKSSARLIPEGSVVFSSRATIGKIAITDCSLATNQGFTNFICPENLLNRYLAYALVFLTPSIASLSNSTTFREVSKTNIKGVEIPLPPLNEQKRIVAKLDALFTRIDTAITHLQQTLELSKALFESASAHVFKDSDEWDTVKLSVLLERGWITSHLDGNHGSNYPRKAEFVDEGVPYISANCIRDGEVIMSLSKYLTIKRAAMLRKGIAINNDVLFAHNATVGPVAILQTDCEKVILSTSLTYYRCDPKYILPEYLAQYMKASPFTSQYRAVMSQSTRNQVPITKQREFTHIIPPIKEQSRIAALLDALSERTRALEAATEEKLNDLTTLKASLLDAAFKGQL